MSVPGDLVPLGEHLSVSVWPAEPTEGLTGAPTEEPTEEMWTRLVAMLTSARCEPASVGLMASQDGPFRHVSDLPREEVVADVRRLVATASGRLLRLGFQHPRWGWVALGLGAASVLGEAHPWEVTLGADVMGIPPQMWSKQDRARARSLARWLDELMVDMGMAVSAAYGGRGCDLVLPSPSALRTGQDRMWWPDTWWLGPEVCATVGSAQEVAATVGDGASVVAGSVLCHGWRSPSAVDQRVLDAAVDLLTGALQQRIRTQEAGDAEVLS